MIQLIRTVTCFALVLLARSTPFCAAQTTGTMTGPPLLKVDYENGALNSGIDGLNAVPPPAADSIVIDQGTARTGDKSIRSKVADTPEYISAGAHRAESDTIKLPQTCYNEGDYRRYQFSILLPPDWEVDNRDSIDIIWQFKRFSSKPDMFVAVKGADIVLRTGATRQDTLVQDYRTGEWIDFQLDILWTTGAAGSVKAAVGFGALNPYRPVIAFGGPNLLSGNKDETYLKWGLYKPDYTTSIAKNPRVIHHDDIEVLPLEDIYNAVSFAVFSGYQ